MFKIGLAVPQPVGVRVNNTLSQQWLKRIYIGFLVMIALYMLIASLRG